MFDTGAPAGLLAGSIELQRDLRGLMREHAWTVPAVCVADRNPERTLGSTDEDRRQLDPERP